MATTKRTRNTETARSAPAELGRKQAARGRSGEHHPNAQLAKNLKGSRQTATRAFRGDTGVARSVAEPSASIASFRSGSKASAIIELLRRDGGAGMPELVAATGWQSHSVRGFVSGALKKNLGLVIVSEKAGDGIRRYRIAG